MPYSIAEIKTFESLDLEVFEVRGAKFGTNNARSTSPLYTRGPYSPQKNVFTGSAVLVSGDSTVTGISYDAPFSGLDASILLAGDTLDTTSESMSVVEVISTSSVTVNPAPGSDGTQTITYRLLDRDYLVEPDVTVNTVDDGLATFTNGSNVVDGQGTNWLTDLSPGDSIQLNSYQKYFIVNTVVSDVQIQLTANYTGETATGFYTAKRWRLDRLNYQYTKQDFEYNKNDSVWEYDSTSGSGLVATSTWQDFIDGIDLKFSPTLKPADYPDLMDSNLVLNKTLSQETQNDMFQFSLPVVPKPEESFVLYINDKEKDMFPDGDMDYILNYWQTPTYQYPPPIEERKIAGVMFLQPVQNVNLDPVYTEAGSLAFTDTAGNNVLGIMPGSETIKFDGTVQSLYEDYIIDVDSGIGYASGHVTNEPIVKYVAFERDDLWDYGINIYLDGTKQQLTIPRNEDDEVIFDFETGRFKPADKDNPGSGEEYIIEYLTEDEYTSDEIITVTDGMTSFNVAKYPVMFQSVIVQKNGIFLDEGTDYRVSCLTGRVVLFDSLVRGDSIIVNYQPLIERKDGVTYSEETWYTKVYASESPVVSISPPEFRLQNPNLIDNDTFVLLKAYNVTKSEEYDITGYIIRGSLVHLQSNATNTSFQTDLSDVIELDYRFENEGTEYTPVMYINNYLEEDQDYIYFVNQDLTSLFPVGTVIRLTNVDSEGDYFFKVATSVYDGEDTTLTFDGTVPVEITNPYIYISDATLDYTSVGDVPNSISSGATDIIFPDTNITQKFRAGKILNIDTDYYYIQKSEYDSSSLATTVSVAVPAYKDYTSSSILSSMQISDVPIYYEGDTEISTELGLLEEPIPAMTLNYDGLVTFSCDQTGFAVVKDGSQYEFPYTSYPTIDTLASAINGIGVSAVNYVTDWTSSKIQSQTDAVVTEDSSSAVWIDTALRYDGTDTTGYEVSLGLVNLDNELVKLDRYNFDYLGQQYLGDTTVNWSGSYFSLLLAKSKISASFKFENLDQFYVQVMNQRNFLEQVIEPAMKERATQQSGNVGQGGEVAGDDAAGNSEGGLEGDEFRRVDTDIECKVFNTIFDFFNSRLEAFRNEYYAAFGWKICNNDGLLSETDESSGAKSINRMFPWGDYTDMAPYKIACLSSESVPWSYKNSNIPPGSSSALAVFTNGSAVVSNVSVGDPSYWTWQLKVGDYIRPLDTTKLYEIQSVDNNSQVTLTGNFDGSSSLSVGEPYVIKAKVPFYDDDAHMGGKLIGNKSSDFGIVAGDVFDATVDGVSQSYTFASPTDPYVASMFPLNKMSASDVAEVLNQNLSDIRVTAEWDIDINVAYGYKDAIFLRTDGTKNEIIAGSGSAVSKLGFTPGESSSGNFDNTGNNPEYQNLVAESNDLASEISSLNTLVSAGVPNKLGRVTPGSLAQVATVNSLCADEVIRINRQIDRLNIEIASTEFIMEETGFPSYSDTSTAYHKDSTYLASSIIARDYANSIATNYEGQNTAARWVLNITQDQQTIRGTDSTNVGVPDSTGIGITSITGETDFILKMPDPSYDKRYLNTIVDSVDYIPVIRFSDNNVIVDGTFSGWDPGVSNNYSINDEITFHISNTDLFVLDASNSSFSYETDANSLTLKWDSIYSRVFNYSSYPTVGDLKTAINMLAGLTTSGSATYDGTSTSVIQVTGTTAISPNVDVEKNLQTLFYMYPDSTRVFNYSIDTTAFNLYWDTTTETLLYSTYPTVGTMRAAVDAVSGMGVISYPAHDGTSSQEIQNIGITAVGGGVSIYDKPYLFTITADHTYNISYSIDKSGLSMSWDGSGKYFDYGTYSTISTVKSGINSTVPGVKAVGSATHDSSNSLGLRLTESTLIPPDSTVYSGLRDCFVVYNTIDDELLSDRTDFVTPRKTEVDDRIIYLSTVREGQIIQHIKDEEFFMDSNGEMGNIYLWANNRFNRSAGCEARLKQIEKQIEVNQASLGVSSNFL